MSGLARLRTGRLLLRGIEAADTEAVLRVFADPGMSRYFEADFSDREQALTMIRRRLDYTGPAGTGHWVIELATPDEQTGTSERTVIGVAHLRPSTELPGELPELGYYVDSACAGRGFATEAATALIRHGFGALGLTSIWALVHQDNAASLAVTRRLGFTDVGSGEHYGATHRVHVLLPDDNGRLHHVELWVPDLARARAGFGWLLGELGWTEYQSWEHGVSWKLGPSYLVMEQSPALTAAAHDRLRPGLNHLALHVSGRQRVDQLAATAVEHGWRPLFAERYPWAGGPEHYAAFLENEDGFEVELVACPEPTP